MPPVNNSPENTNNNPAANPPTNAANPPANPPADPAPANDGEKEGGKSGMTDAEHKLLKEVMDKKAQIKEQADKINQLEAVTKALEELGGLDAIKKMVQAKKEAEQKDLEARGEWEKLKTQMAEEHVKATKSLNDQIADLQGKLKAEEAKIAELTVGAAFANSEFLKSKTILAPNKARVIYADHFDISADGSVVAYDKPRGAAGRTALVDAVGNGLGFEAAIEKIIMADPDHDTLLRSKGSAGSGSGTTNHVASQNQQTTKPQLTGTEMIAQALAALKK